MISQTSMAFKAKVFLAGWKSTFAVSTLLFLGACGGGSSTPPASISSIDIALTSLSSEVEAGAPNLVISARISGSAGAPNWRLEGNLGSLGASAGNTVDYIPPPLGTVEAASNVKITASVGTVSKSITLLVRPSASGTYAYAGAVRGWGYIDGEGNAARFALPNDIVADAEDNLYVWDEGNNRIRRLSKAAAVSTYAAIIKPSTASYRVWLKLRHFSGRFMYTKDAEEALLISSDGSKIPVDYTDLPDIADYRDIDGNIYHRGSTVYGKSFATVTKNRQVLAGNAPATVAKDGVGSDASFVAISNLVVFPNKMVYVLDQELASGKYQLRQISPAGVVSTLSTAKFESPARIIPNAGALPTVLDRNGIHKLQAGGNWSFTSISDGKLLPAKNLQFDSPDATADKDGNIYLTDPILDRIVRVTAQGNVSIFAGMLDGKPRSNRLDGRVDAARFLHPYAMSKDPAGNLYVIEDTPNLLESDGQSWKQHALTLRKIAVDGTVTTLSAPNLWWGKADSTKMAETFTAPNQLVVDNDSSIWIFNRLLMVGSVFVPPTPFGENAIWKITPDGKRTKVTAKIADCPTSVREWKVCDMVFDGKDNLFVADGDGVHKLQADGSLTKLSGMESIGAVSALASDSKGNLYFARDPSSDPGIYKRTAAGSVAKLHNTNPHLNSKMLADDQGNIYFSKACALYKLSSSGVETLIAGAAGQCGMQLGNLQSTRLHQITSFLWLGSNSLYATVDDAILKIVLP